MRKLLPAILLLAFGASFAFAQATPAPTPATPLQTVREFYKALREKRFREAFMMSTYRPAIEGLTAEELEELAPDFAATMQGIPEKLDVSDEEIKGDNATVMVNLAAPGEPFIPKEMKLRRENGVWVIVDEEAEKAKTEGKNYFFRLRIENHQEIVEELMPRIYRAQTIFLSQARRFGTINELLAAQLLPPEVKDSDVTGYQIRVNVAADGRSYTAQAEPTRYGRSGKLSYYIDHTGRLEREDTQGKPVTPKKK
jgi:hypothetical protein